ncbi:RNA-binding domain-containing protein [Lophiostoma macrostomum CBS 122681]|uniref:RNA-binding domain-containing protein n=1 Tax=Lophiostoma macrostomum CBS 122681 TaxID=1314788 RepID=A0A6A6TCX3_9PLEO|nr:RNA-binding domain-containing protein [Lophiostoma macrostomum CBS 122681]
MNTVRAIQKLNKRELEEGITPEGSWHTDYRDTAFVYVGGLPFELSEGDIIAVFSQFGEPVWIKLARDKETGKSRGFCWLKYEDQRSTDLAVDNLGGATLMGRVLRVDHTRYKPRDDEDMRDNTMGELDADDQGRRKRRKTESDSESDEDRPLFKEEVELEKLLRDVDDEDPMKGAMVHKKREEVETALKKYEKAKRKEKRHRPRRHHRDKSIERDGHRSRSRDRRHRDGSHERARHRDRSGERRYLKGRSHDGDRSRRERDRRRHDSSDDEGSRHKRSSRRDRSISGSRSPT